MDDHFRPLPVPRVDDPAENFLVASKMSGLVSGAYSEAYAFEFATEPEALGRFGVPTLFDSRGGLIAPPSRGPQPRALEEGDHGMTVVDALRRRRSQHRFDPTRPVAFESVSRILNESAGVTDEYGRGTPSPGRLYPLDCVLVAADVDGLASGFYGYDPFARQLVGLNVAEDPRPWLRSVLAYQSLGETASCHIFVAASFDRVRIKYGQRAHRFALIEAGHLVQSMLLVAESEGIGSCPIGGYFDAAVDRALGFDGVDCSVVYGAAFGQMAVDG
jgi:SagB-type dehydrogenase family enzyme